jgi:hypothetical protein
MAEDAVSRELISVRFPANREKCREYGTFDRDTWEISLRHGVDQEAKLHS